MNICTARNTSQWATDKDRYEATVKHGQISATATGRSRRQAIKRAKVKFQDALNFAGLRDKDPGWQQFAQSVRQQEQRVQEQLADIERRFANLLHSIDLTDQALMEHESQPAGAAHRKRQT